MLTLVSLQNNVDALHPLVASLDFSRLKHKYTASTEAEMTPEEWDNAQREYQRFLTLKTLHPQEVLVPTKEVDTIWHAHILDTRSYRHDCERLFGRFIDHYPYFGIYGDDDYANLQNAFERTCELYEKHFGPIPDQANATRCADHACHVVSTCACRVSGACN